MDYYRIEVKQSAARDIKKIPKIYIKKITSSVTELERNPFPGSCKKIKSSESMYRIRIGDYRVIYEVITNEKLVIIHYIRHRKDVYRNL